MSDWHDAARIGGPPLVVNVNGQRMYQHPVDGHHMPAITSILGVIDKPALVGWSARETAIAAFENRFALVRVKDQGAAVDMLKNARYRSSGEKAKVGTTVHQIAQALALDERLPLFDERHAPYADSFLMFVEDYKPRFTHVEATVFSDTYDYAGTFDFLGEIDGLLILGDHKTGKGVYEEVGLQLAAARFAEHVWDSLTGELHPMPEVRGCIAVHLQPDGYQVFHVRADRRDHAAFLGARQVWPWFKGGESRGAVGPAMSPQRLTKAVRPEPPSQLLDNPRADVAPTTTRSSRDGGSAPLKVVSE